MKRTLYTLTLVACILCMPLDTYAQRISHTYNNVSLSEALLQLNNEQKEYVINFLYNELEDFRVTATIKNKRLSDAIQQMIGFYPVRMTVKPDDHEIYVECTHKTDRHLTGTIAAISLFHTSKRKSLPESPTLDTRPSINNALRRILARYAYNLKFIRSTVYK